jgi:NTE family protein
MRSLSLALGGGGVRGAAHLGVLRALEEAGLPPAGIAGTSSGAIVAMLYAMELSDGFGVETYQHIERIGSQGYAELRFLFHPQTARAVTLGDRLKVLAGWERVIRSGVFGAGMVSQEALRSNLIALVGGARFQDARLPLAFIAVDLHSGEKVVLKSGSMLEAALASSAIPGVFPPVNLNGLLLVDGHVVDNIPVDDARDLVDDAFVLAVDVGDASTPSTPKTALEVILRASAISRDHLRRQSLKGADMVLSLSDVAAGAFEYERSRDLSEIGFERMTALIPALRARLEDGEPQFGGDFEATELEAVELEVSLRASTSERLESV